MLQFFVLLLCFRYKNNIGINCTRWVILLNVVYFEYHYCHINSLLKFLHIQFLYPGMCNSLTESDDLLIIIVVEGSCR